MTERDLKKLNRLELLEMLLTLSKENDGLIRQVAQLNAAAEERRIDLEQAGSIADAAMSISGVFQSAQEAADLYLSSILAKESECEAKARHMLEETQRRCDQMLDETRREIDQRWQRFHVQMEELHRTIPGLEQMTWGDGTQEGESVHV